MMVHLNPASDRTAEPQGSRLPAPGVTHRLGAVDVLVLSLWCGLAAGLLELYAARQAHDQAEDALGQTRDDAQHAADFATQARGDSDTARDDADQARSARDDAVAAAEEAQRCAEAAREALG